MPSFTPLNSQQDFNGGFYVEWAARPPAFPPNPMMPGTPYHAGNADYVFAGQSLHIDVTAPQVTLSVCDDHFIAGQFTPGESLLVANMQPGRMSAHLTFNPPVRAVGCRIAAEGLAGEAFLGLINVRDAASGAWFRFGQPSQVSLAFDTAPFVGLASDGLIDEAWFDVKRPGLAQPFAAVLVGSLFYLPS